MLNNSTSKNAGSGISKEADLGHDKIGKLLFNLAFPAILAQIINVLYNMVDRMYIGHIEHIGPDALTGVGVTMPVIMCISAFAALVSMGGAPRASIMMGKGRNDQAEKILGNCTSMLLIISITLPPVRPFRAADVRSQRKDNRIRMGLHGNLRVRHDFRSACAGTQCFYQCTGLCENRHDDGCHRRRMQYYT